jgi:3-isopropylmalate/(R)-2-methylmalate dehydratase small subunit
MIKNKIEGRAWVLKDDDINTDLIYPGKYTYESLAPKEQAKHALEDYDPEFAKEVEKNDIIVTGKNFGCGSSREQAVSSLKYAGVSAIIAKSFARIFFRNSINSALLAIECPEAVSALFEANTKFPSIEIDLSKGKILFKGKEYSFPALDKQAMLIFESGGLVEYTKIRLRKRTKTHL